jgi:hypothetical protein
MAANRRWRAARAPAAGVALVLAVVLAGCGGAAGSTTLGLSPAAAGPPSAADIRAYVAQVERFRLPVNRLLLAADPILDGFRSETITPQEAGDQMSALEQHFATYVVAAHAINPQNATLRKLNAPYANTYYLEDNYLSVLAADLPNSSFDVPDTQNAQRLAIIGWRTQLQVVADAAGVRLPADIQAAGRGEIAPSPTGS